MHGRSNSQSAPASGQNTCGTSRASDSLGRSLSLIRMRKSTHATPRSSPLAQAIVDVDWGSRGDSPSNVLRQSVRTRPAGRFRSRRKRSPTEGRSSRSLLNMSPSSSSSPEPNPMLHVVFAGVIASGAPRRYARWRRPGCFRENRNGPHHASHHRCHSFVA